MRVTLRSVGVGGCQYIRSMGAEEVPRCTFLKVTFPKVTAMYSGEKKHLSDRLLSRDVGEGEKKRKHCKKSKGKNKMAEQGGSSKVLSFDHRGRY